MTFPPPPKPIQNNLLSAITAPPSSTLSNHSDDESISPLTQTRTTTKIRGTKPPPLPLHYPKPNTSAITDDTPTTPNWNDLPHAWTHPATRAHINAQHPNPRPLTARSSSSTGLDITALYATANPRVTPRRRLSSMIHINSKTQPGVSVSAPNTPAFPPSGAPPPPPPPPYQASTSPQSRLYEENETTDSGWRDEKDGSIENGPRGSISDPYGYGQEEIMRKRGIRRKTVKGVLIMTVLLTMGVLGIWMSGVEVASSFGLVRPDAQNVQMGGESASIFGFNTSGFGYPNGGAGEFVQRCKAQALTWRPKLPEFLAKYFSDAGDDTVREGAEIQTLTRTIRVVNGDLTIKMPSTISRILRGKGPVRIMQDQHEDEEDDDDEYEDDDDDDEEWDREFGGSGQGDGNDGGENNTEQNHADGSDIENEKEEEAHRARASEMWMKHDAPIHATVAPIADDQHGGHQAVIQGDGQQ